jgi:hypothetical protein
LPPLLAISAKLSDLALAVVQARLPVFVLHPIAPHRRVRFSRPAFSEATIPLYTDEAVTLGFRAFIFRLVRKLVLARLLVCAERTLSRQQEEGQYSLSNETSHIYLPAV